MTSQYDEIAEEFQNLADMDARMIVNQTFMEVLGAVQGKEILDLACGEGFVSRILKQMGAARVLGVDNSEQMIALGRKQEEAEPIGVEYQLGDAGALGKVGDFDLVTASFLLMYAPTPEALLGMCQTAFDNLRPGGRFVTINYNVELGRDCYLGKEKYGAAYQLPDGSLEEGAKIVASLSSGGHQVSFDMYYFKRETQDELLRSAGFRDIAWHTPKPFPDIEDRYDPGFWDDFHAKPALRILECSKPAG